MSRWVTYATLGLLVIVLGAMSWVVERAGKPEKPKPPTAEQNAAREAAMKQRMAQEAESRTKMMAGIKDAAGGKGKGEKGKPGQRPVNPTAPPEMDQKGGKKQLPAGALDISGDWFKTRKPGDHGLAQLEKEAAANPPAPAPPPKLAPTVKPQ
ncbi:MAG: hypothetical protein FJX72_21710 [Armatimonadetes bacterium]|nr:hypothetical protein [Armatimonadota bacterium]